MVPIRLVCVCCRYVIILYDLIKHYPTHNTSSLHAFVKMGNLFQLYLRNTTICINILISYIHIYLQCIALTLRERNCCHRGISKNDHE